MRRSGFVREPVRPEAASWLALACALLVAPLQGCGAETTPPVWASQPSGQVAPGGGAPPAGGATRDAETAQPTRTDAATATADASARDSATPSEGELDASIPSADDAGSSDAGADAGIPPRPRIYASMAGDHEVLELDGETHEVIRRFAVDQGPAILLGTPDRQKLFTANWLAQSISTIETDSGEVSTLPLGGRPYVIAMDPAGTRLYAGVYPSGIAVIDVATSQIEKTLPTPELAASIIVSPDGEVLYVATVPLFGDGTLRAVSARTGEVLKQPIPVGGTPAWITISPDGRRVYTLNYTSDDVAVVDTQSWRVTIKIQTGAGSKGIIGHVTPDGSALYVSNFGTGELIRIDTVRNEVTQTIELEGRPVGVSFSPDGKRVHVTDFGAGTLDQPTSDFLPYLLAGSYEGPAEGRVTVFDVASGRQLDEILVGKGPTSVVVSAGNAPAMPQAL
jgi:YVTN family beta-propeller protein